MTCRDRTLLLSDLHLTAQSLYTQGLAWFHPSAHLARLETFLDRHVLAASARETLARLVLLGDTFDNWVVPKEQEPPSYAEIAASNASVLERLSEATRLGVEVVVVAGNHDLELDPGLVARMIPGARFAREVHVGRHVIARHGHERSVFNTAEYFDDPTLDRPLGYFFGRAASALDGPAKALHSPAAIARYIRSGALGAWQRDDFMGGVMEVIFPALGVADADVFVLEGGAEVSVAEVKARYRLAARPLPPPERLRRLWDRARYLPRTAALLHHEQQCPIVVLGHVHRAELRRYPGGALSLNCGAWCQHHAHCVEITGPLDLSWVTARLFAVAPDASLQLRDEARAHARARRMILPIP